MMRRELWFAAALVGAVVLGTPPSSAQTPRMVVEKQETISIGEVPEEAISVAKDALQADPEKAYLATLTDGQQVYGLEAAGEEIVYVTDEGEIVETEGESVGTTKEQ